MNKDKLMDLVLKGETCKSCNLNSYMLGCALHFEHNDSYIKEYNICKFYESSVSLDNNKGYVQ